MATTNLDFNNVVAQVIKAGATRSKQYNIHHTWYGWVTKDVLHVVSQSGAKRREIWHFDIEKNAGREVYFKNTTGTADCWLVIPAGWEADPYIRLLRLCKQSKKVLHRHQVGDEVFLSGTWAHLYCHVPGRSSTTLVTDSTEEVVKGELLKEGNMSHFESRTWEVSLKEASWAVVRGARADSNGRVHDYISELHIWGNPDVEAVARAVAGWLYSDGADMAFLEAQSSGDFKPWLKSIVRPGSQSKCIYLGEDEYEIGKDGYQAEYGLKSKTSGQSLAASWVGHPDKTPAVEFNRLPQEEWVKLLPPDQKEYFDALVDFEKAKDFIMKNVEFYIFDDELFYLFENSELVKVREGSTEETYRNTGDIELLSSMIHGDSLVQYVKKLAKKLKKVAEVENYEKFEEDEVFFKNSHFDKDKEAKNCFWLDGSFRVKVFVTE